MRVLKLISGLLAMLAAGVLVGRWAYSQGWGGLLAFGLATVVGPVIVGCLAPRWGLGLAVALNAGIVVGVVTSRVLWSLDHGSDLAREVHEGWPVWVVMGPWAVMCAALALIGRKLRQIVSASMARAGEPPDQPAQQP